MSNIALIQRKTLDIAHTMNLNWRKFDFLSLSLYLYLIEKDEECFSQAKARLQLVEKAKADLRTDRTTRASAASQKKADQNGKEAASRSVAVGTFSANSETSEDFHQTCGRSKCLESQASICIYSPSCAGKTKYLEGNPEEENTAPELQNSETDCESQNSPKRSAPEAAENIAPTKAAKCAADSGRRQRSKRSNAEHANENKMIESKCATGDLCIMKHTAPTHKCQTCKTAMIHNICDYGRRTRVHWDRDNQFACSEVCMKRQPVQGQ